jgi:hypothetical protein
VLLVTVVGSPQGVRETILTLYRLGFAQVGDWSPLQRAATAGHVMSVLIRRKCDRATLRRRENKLSHSQRTQQCCVPRNDIFTGSQAQAWEPISLLTESIQDTSPKLVNLYGNRLTGYRMSPFPMSVGISLAPTAQRRDFILALRRKWS